MDRAFGAVHTAIRAGSPAPRVRRAQAIGPRPTPWEKRVTARRTALAIVVSAVAAATVSLAHPARAIAAPQRAEVHYASTYVDVRWSAVADATSYAVEVSKDGYYGPWRRWSTSSSVTNVRIPLADHPYRDRGGSYRYKVFALNSDGSAARSVVVTKLQGSAVSVADKEKAAGKANSCLKQGLAAGVAAASTTGVAAIVTAWIPGANLVTAGMVAASTGSASASAYIVCALPW